MWITVGDGESFTLWVLIGQQLLHFLLAVSVALPLTLTTFYAPLPKVKWLGLSCILSGFLLGACSHFVADLLQPWF